MGLELQECGPHFMLRFCALVHVNLGVLMPPLMSLLQPTVGGARGAQGETQPELLSEQATVGAGLEAEQVPVR